MPTRISHLTNADSNRVRFEMGGMVESYLLALSDAEKIFLKEFEISAPIPEELKDV